MFSHSPVKLLHRCVSILLLFSFSVSASNPTPLQPQGEILPKWRDGRRTFHFDKLEVHIDQQIGRPCGPRSHRPWWLEEREAGNDAVDPALSVFDGTGSVVWESGTVFCQWLSQHQHEVAQKSVLELGITTPYPQSDYRGSGTGLVSIVCEAYGSSETIATDTDEQLPLIRHNADLNMRSQIKVVRCEWGNAADIETVRQELKKRRAAHPQVLRGAEEGGGKGGGAVRRSSESDKPDVIVATDVVYGQKKAILCKLLDTLYALCEPGQTQILITTKVRDGSSASENSSFFFAECKARFDVNSEELTDGDGTLTLLRLSLKPPAAHKRDGHA